MAGNDWVNSYLEAILDLRPAINADKSSLLLRERGGFNPTRYFVEEVITGFDETDFHKTWVRTAAMRNDRSPQERNTRLENMCWRIWNLARKKKQTEGEEATQLSRRLLREKARQDSTVGMSEDLSEEEKSPARGESTRACMPKINSVDTIETWANEHKDKRLYIVLLRHVDSIAFELDNQCFIIHGLIRGENMELGRDSDTGGQVKYIVELARALGSTPGVHRVDLLTRQILADDVDWIYAEPVETLTSRNCENDESPELPAEGGGAYIIRIPFGPRGYIRKELLWPHIQEFVDGALMHIMHVAKSLGEQIGDGKPVWPIIIHGHYADAGGSAALLSGALNVPMVFTGHSLGKDKLEQLLKQGKQSREEINVIYKIMQRIEAEELCLDASEVIITSTRQEIKEQWKLYDGFDLILARNLRARIERGVSCYGKYMPRMVLIPPGMEFSHVVVPDVDMDGDVEVNVDGSGDSDLPIWEEIMRFFTNRCKPMILALARPDPKKNITTLVKAFGECRQLRELANLTLIMGNRDNIDEMSSTNTAVLTSILKLIDKYDLYGQVAYPKHHKQSEVPDIYRLAAKTKGVFINPAFIEPFGLTLIEAAAHGLPIVATNNGGPIDIHKILNNGILVDPHNQNAIADALYKLVSDKQLWLQCRKNGLKNIHQFSWPEHCKKYLLQVTNLQPRHPQWDKIEGTEKSESDDSLGDSSRDIQDLTLNLNNLLNDKKVTEDGSVKNVIGTLKEHPMTRNNLRSVIMELSKGLIRPTKKDNSVEKTNKMPLIRKRKNIIVIAIDSVSSSPGLIDIIKSIFEALAGQRSSGSVGFVVATSMNFSTIHSLLVASGLLCTEFDAFICNSGGDVYYPSYTSDDVLSTGQILFTADQDYHSQIEYRWGGEELRKALLHWTESINEKKGESEEPVIVENIEGSSPLCFAFNVRNPKIVPPVKELRKLMRIQALRCNVLYSHDGSRLNVIPVLASRSQASRYLYVRWGIELTKMVIIVGESGDTDYEALLGGMHKTLILKGPFNTVASQLHAARSYSFDDSPNIVQVEGCTTSEIICGLQKLGMIKA
ncbi:putative sucrose-phosphate synthase 1 [Carex littledalei]|uniref:Sucrose-phosphate synthase n=1 Tax=Carex littledalei TaxID=544730 RepID=A0A833V5N9_9POAL|nr:putative sucrose-phosphate synthase 1 [Carex littledalei]